MLELNDVVANVEAEMSQYRPCPLCGQYGDPAVAHQAGCAYLVYKGMIITPEENPDSGSPVTTFNSAGADVASADEASSPVSNLETMGIVSTTETESPTTE